MALTFYKYQGTGNDFVMVDNRKHTFPTDDEALVKQLCDRRTGVGADGLILLQDHPDYDFEMVYYNADGRLGSMCGNGATFRRRRPGRPEPSSRHPRAA